MQLKSLALLGVEGYAVLLNISNSDCRVLCGSDTAQEYVEAEEEKGHAGDDMFFKYMCGESVKHDHGNIPRVQIPRHSTCIPPSPQNTHTKT